MVTIILYDFLAVHVAGVVYKKNLDNALRGK